MADRVIIVDVNRGKELIDIATIKQMVGRVSRKEGQNGTVNFVLSTEIYDEFIEAYNDEENLVVNSIFDIKEASFHLLSEIVRGKVSDIHDAKNWYEKSFYYYQNKSGDIEEAIKLLEKQEAIKIDNGQYIYTQIGEIANRFYFHAEDIVSWRNNFNSLFELEIEENDLAKSWALSNVNNFHVKGDARKYFAEIENYNRGLDNLGLYPEKGTLLSGLIWWSFFGGCKVTKLISGIKEVRENFGRIFSVLKLLNYHCKWDKDQYFENLSTQFNYKTEEKYVFLCQIKGITKSQAIYLYNEYNIHSMDDLIEKLEGLSEVISYETYCNIKRGNF